MQAHANNNINAAVIEICKQYTYRKESEERNVINYLSTGNEIYKNNAIKWAALAKQSKEELAKMMSLVQN